MDGHKTLLGLAALQCSVRIMTNSGSHSLTPGPGPAINPKPPHPCPAGQVTHVALERYFPERASPKTNKTFSKGLGHYDGIKPSYHTIFTRG